MTTRISGIGGFEGDEWFPGEIKVPEHPVPLTVEFDRWPIGSAVARKREDGAIEVTCEIPDRLAQQLIGNTHMSMSVKQEAADRATAYGFALTPEGDERCRYRIEETGSSYLATYLDRLQRAGLEPGTPATPAETIVEIRPGSDSSDSRLE